MKAALAALFFALLLGFFAWLLAPGILADYALDRNALEPAAGVRIKEARCKSKMFVISLCEVKVEPAETAGAIPAEFDYLIFGNLGDERVQILRSKLDGRLTTNVGLDYLVNRVVSFVVTEGFMLALCVGGLIGLFRGAEASR